MRHEQSHDILDSRQLYDILEIGTSDKLLNEVQVILKQISPQFNMTSVTSAFHTILSLYEGSYPGYRACNTLYHDIQHTLTTSLATIRLIHGAVLNNEKLTQKQISLGLISALFHDTGYIQDESDKEGTGAKYTATHVQRSMDFLQRHGSEYGLSDKEIDAGKIIILCTDITVDIFNLDFPSPEIDLLGKILAVADVIAQMSDRIYLEKLLYLYKEFKEAKIQGFESEVDLLQQTIGFYDFIELRLEKLYDKINQFLKSHFFKRWNIHENLYRIAIIRHRDYLKKIMKEPDPLSYLKRAGIVNKIRKEHGDI